MEELMKNDEFLETAEFSGNIYGTSKSSVEHVLDSGKICLLDIDIQGVKTLKKTGNFSRARFVFVRAPSLTVLEERLRARGTETEESLQKRIINASKEIEYGQEEGNFDRIIVNDDLDTAYNDFTDFILHNFQIMKNKANSL